MKKTHICLNMTGGSNWIGGSIYTQNLARAIASLDYGERQHIKVSVSVYRENQDLSIPIHNCVDKIYIRGKLQKAYLKIAKTLAEKVTFIPSTTFNFEKFDFVYPTVAGHRAPYQWGGWIPDFQSYHLPKLFSADEIRAREQWHQAVASFAPVVVLSSEMAQNDLKRFYPEAYSRSTVMRFATSFNPKWFNDNPELVQKKYNLPDRFFLVSNQFWKHKDHSSIVEALILLKQKGIKPTVVCTGKTYDPRDPDYFKQLSSKVETFNLSDQFYTLGLIPREDQIQLMRRCLSVIQPSQFEGWSTVVEDARTLGKPLILSDFPVHVEQNPPGSLFFEQGNVCQLADLIAESHSTLLPGPDLEKEQIARCDNQIKVKEFGRRFLEIALNNSK